MWHPMDFWPWWIVPGIIWTVVFWGVVAWIIVTLINRDSGSRRSHALDILEERYARGEISREEFEEMRRTLRS
jgi:putative membrane protein